MTRIKPFDVAAILQTFREKPQQPERLVTRLIAAADGANLTIQVLVNDDSGEQPDAWRKVLRPQDVYQSSANIHEVRAYNLLGMRAANSSTLLAFLQGDECLPITPSWLLEAHHLFIRHGRLGVLGGHAGFLEPGSDETTGPIEMGFAYGPYPRRPPIPYTVHRMQPHSMGEVDRLPLVYVPFVNIGPYFVRSTTFVELNGFTSDYGDAGEPGGHFDAEFSLRCWMGGFGGSERLHQDKPKVDVHSMNTFFSQVSTFSEASLIGHRDATSGRLTDTSAWDYYWAVGLYYGRVGNGVGGHKTRLGAQGRMRKRNQRRAARDLRERWSKHNGTVGARISAENGQLLRLEAEKALELQKERREGQATCGGKKL